MPRAKLIFDDTAIRIECPGCGHGHIMNLRTAGKPGASWNWNGSLDAPTLHPSLKVTWNETGGPVMDKCCHSFITDGRIQYLNDCTHALRGQTVDLPEIPA